jgi:hypothetical protein
VLQKHFDDGTVELIQCEEAKRVNAELVEVIIACGIYFPRT